MKTEAELEAEKHKDQLEAIKFKREEHKRNTKTRMRDDQYSGDYL